MPPAATPRARGDRHRSIGPRGAVHPMPKGQGRRESKLPADGELRLFALVHHKGDKLTAALIACARGRCSWRVPQGHRGAGTLHAQLTGLADQAGYGDAVKMAPTKRRRAPSNFHHHAPRRGPSFRTYRPTRGGADDSDGRASSTPRSAMRGFPIGQRGQERDQRGRPRTPLVPGHPPMSEVRQDRHPRRTASVANGARTTAPRHVTPHLPEAQLRRLRPDCPVHQVGVLHDVRRPVDIPNGIPVKTSIPPLLVPRTAPAGQ